MENKKSNVALEEEKILKFWEENKIFEKSLENRKGNERFVFFEGPPTANGMPHPGHVLTRALKDIILRYKTMKGYYVPRKAGWDTHGLPVELEVEKMLGLNNKKDIENYGVEEFISKCKESVWKYKKEWEDMTKRIGMWLDLENAYVTYENYYIESVWWALKQFFDAGLLYEGHKIVPYCPRCGTALSSHEVAQGYKEVEENSIYVKFKAKDEENLYYLVWTTTPWTLPSNVALAVNPDITYVKVQVESGEKYILCKDRLGIIDEKYEILEEFTGKDLEYREYEPLFKFVNPNKKCWYVVNADYVSTEDGTGIVHIAPAFGAEDYEVGTKYNLPVVNLVKEDGTFKEEVEWKGMFVKEADKYIIRNLKERGLFFKLERYKHNYPFCWRCDTPLLYYARHSWFIKTTAYKDKMIEYNQTVNWHPEYIKDGRFGEFLKNNIDWALSRSRYWGTPLPVWRCKSCGHLHCIGSVEELKNMQIEGYEENMDLHKPYIDRVVLKCPNCGEKMVREPEVIDCWFDSGCMYIGQQHYPFENKEEFEKSFPADYICEAIDQTRGWFYTLLATSSFLFKKAPYKNVVTLGLILGEDGQKMSKSKRNYVPANLVWDSEGADAIRWYFYASTVPWNAKKFSLDAVREVNRKFLNKIRNVWQFWRMYADIDNYNPFDESNKVETDNLLDRWILSKLNSLIDFVNENLDKYQITQAANKIEDFVEELSNWYVRRNRRRFWKFEVDNDKKAAYNTLHHCLVELAKLIAVFTPFLAESMWQDLVTRYNKEKISVHLEDYPVVNEKLIDKDLEKYMEDLQLVVEQAREARNISKIKNRQPLPVLYVYGVSVDDAACEIIKDEINVKKVENASFEFIKDIVDFDLRVNFAKLGPKYQDFAKEIAKWIKENKDIVWQLREKSSSKVNVLGQEIELEYADLKVKYISKDKNYEVSGSKEAIVILDKTIDEELELEGLYREFVHTIQNIRKKSKLNVTDRIIIRFYSEDEKIKQMIEKYEELIKNETLTLEIKMENIAEKEYKINDRKVNISIEKVENYDENKDLRIEH